MGGIVGNRNRKSRKPCVASLLSNNSIAIEIEVEETADSWNSQPDFLEELRYERRRKQEYAELLAERQELKRAQASLSSISEDTTSAETSSDDERDDSLLNQTSEDLESE